MLLEEEMVSLVNIPIVPVLTPVTTGFYNRTWFATQVSNPYAQHDSMVTLVYTRNGLNIRKS